jgi:hypothetical protein
MADRAIHTRDLSSSMDIPSEQEQKPSPEWPEGGTKAWLVVLGGFCISFSTFGYSNAYGYGSLLFFYTMPDQANNFPIDAASTKITTPSTCFHMKHNQPYLGLGLSKSSFCMPAVSLGDHCLIVSEPK